MGKFGRQWNCRVIIGKFRESMLARKQKLWPHLLLECFRSEPHLGAGCITEGGSLAGKQSASSRSSKVLLLSLGQTFLLFVLMILVLWTLMRRGYCFCCHGFAAYGSPHWNEFDRQLFRRSVMCLAQDFRTGHSARMRAGEKTISTKVPSCSLLLIVKEA
jgi:hypothetical protein